jgi:pimeloyl-ACP methyl ester carboxylesterase
MDRSQLREHLNDTLKFLRRLEGGDPREPLPPPLPEARIVHVENRGEMFVREVPGKEGAPTVVLLHGWTLSSDLNWFSGGYEVASRHGRVVAPDIRGHGRGLRSEQPFTLEAAADDVLALLHHLDAAPAVLVGYSMGGSIAMLCAEREPESVAGLVLASCGLQWRSTMYERGLWLAMGFTEYVMRFGAPEGITDRYLRRAAEQSEELEPYLGWLKAESRRGDPSDIGHAAKALARFDAREVVERIDVPTAVVVTCRDLLIRRRHQVELGEALDAKIIEVDGRHNSWMVFPEEWSAAIDEGIQHVTSSAPSASGDPTLHGEDRPMEQARGREKAPKVAASA